MSTSIFPSDDFLSLVGKLANVGVSIHPYTLCLLSGATEGMANLSVIEGINITCDRWDASMAMSSLAVGAAFIQMECIPPCG